MRYPVTKTLAYFCDAVSDGDGKFRRDRHLLELRRLAGVFAGIGRLGVEDGQRRPVVVVVKLYCFVTDQRDARISKKSQLVHEVVKKSIRS